jgi:glycosyltransferase involved in cell wall biosynthesis
MICTVVLSSFNRPRLIRDALDSILDGGLNQQAVQVLVADDWSTEDGVFAEVKRYQGQFGELRLVRPGQRPPSREERMFGQRCSIAINAVRSYIVGEFICYLCDDDFLLPDSLYVRTEYLKQHPEVNVVYGRLEACKCPSNKFDGGPRDGRHGTSHRPAKDGGHDRASFYSEIPIDSAANRVDHGMFMHRHLRDEVLFPLWPEEVVPGYDCDDSAFVLALEDEGWGPFHSIPEYVVVKRYHGFAHRQAPERRE